MFLSCLPALLSSLVSFFSPFFLWYAPSTTYLALSPVNDFNRAKVQMYDNIRGEYCKYYNGHIGGKFRAPEEFIPDILNEKIDIFSLGNNFYGLLTGLWPHYYDDNEKAQKKYIKGKMPYIDKRYRTRSYAEGQLVEAIKMCHKREPDDRADIFTIVDFLRMSVDENRKQLKE